MTEATQSEREQVLLAAITGANASPNWLTSDMVDALLGGHGMLNIAVINIADVLVTELRRGADTKLRFANAPAQPVDEVLAKAIAAAVKAGAAPANAALLSAVMMYLTGTKAQVGIPAGNRKLGASARMLAGVDRSGVAAIPTAKKNNKVSGFAAVMAVHQALMEGRLSPVSGYDMAVSGGPLVGHGRLGEDVIFPAMAENGARIGTQAMMDAMAGAGMKPHALNAAVFGAAAILEIIHPDADVAEEYGPHGKVTTAFVAGKVAAETAGLPEKLHVRITGQEYSTGQVIGDLGLILKDIGGPSVIGIMAVDEIMGVFEEGIAGSSAGPVNPPLGHVCTDAVIAMKCLLEQGATRESVSAALLERRYDFAFDPETSMVAMNIVAKKAAQLQAGAVTNAMILASEPVRAKALYRRAARAYDALSAGRDLASVVRELDDERKQKVEQRVGAFLSRMTGKDVSIRLTHIGPGARRSSKLAREWFAFDAHIDAELTVDGVTTRLERYSDQVIPDVAQGKRQDIAWAVPMVAPLASEILLASNVIINVTVPAAVAAAMGRLSPEEAGLEAQRAGFVSSGIPGSNVNAEAAARIAVEVMQAP
ncbi:MAG: hypothetical protein ACU85V_00745 [Gammaproteobacteria bacterium]